MKIHRTKILWVSIALNILLITGFTVKKIINYEKVKQEIGFRDVWNINRVDVFNWLVVDSTDIVFIGDSNTEGFPLNELFPGKKIKNRGVSSNKSTHVLGRLKALTEKRPRKIFLQIGINDFYDNEPFDSLVKRYETIVKIIRDSGISVYCESLLPVNYKFGYMNKDAERFNAWLRSYCGKNSITYIDIYTPMLKDGLLDPACTYDGLHLNAEGYKRWKAKVDPFLN